MKRIFDGVLKPFSAAVLVMVLMSGVVHADNTGCDNADNDMINGSFGLCSVHAYNIWETKNTEDSKDFMQQIIAKKTTLITQQMYKQYEQIESMVRRLKTQLEKATLKTKFQYAGANSDDSDGGDGTSKGRELVGIDNCAYVSDIEDALECYERNLNTIRNLSGDGENVTTAHKKQLGTDFKQLSEMTLGNEKTCQADGGTDGVCYNERKDSSSKKIKYMTKAEFKECMSKMMSCLRNAKNIYKNNERSYSNPWNQRNY